MVLRLISGLVAALALTACGVAPTVPPEALLRACRPPAGPVLTNSDLLQREEALKRALRDCDDDKTALRAWAKELK